jgi:hypothetical protein
MLVNSHEIRELFQSFDSAGRVRRGLEPTLLIRVFALGKHFSIAVVWCQVPSSPILRRRAGRLARFSLLSEVGAPAAT